MNKTKEEILDKWDVEYISEELRGYYSNNVTGAMQEYADQQTTHLTDQIKSLEEQVKELKEAAIMQAELDEEIIRTISSQLESLQKEADSNAVKFAEWLEEYGWEIVYSNIGGKSPRKAYVDCPVLNNGSDIYFDNLINSNGKSTQELYELFKSTPSQINN